MGTRITLYAIAALIATVGTVVAVAMQSPIPLVCIALGLGLPLIPVGARNR